PYENRVPPASAESAEPNSATRAKSAMEATLCFMTHTSLSQLQILPLSMRRGNRKVHGLYRLSRQSLSVLLGALEQLDEPGGRLAQRALVFDDNAQRSEELVPGEGDPHQGPALNLALDAQERHNGNAGSNFDTAFESIDIIELHYHADSNLVPPE